MRQIATALFGLGLSIITYGITRYATFAHYVPPDPGASEGDPRTLAEMQHMIVSVIVGLIIFCLSGYFFAKARKTK